MAPHKSNLLLVFCCMYSFLFPFLVIIYGIGVLCFVFYLQHHLFSCVVLVLFTCTYNSTLYCLFDLYFATTARLLHTFLRSVSYLLGPVHGIHGEKKTKVGTFLLEL
uniref:Uncharacterized protein n=1 Tax=Trypanosoma vivax (strain Y486) TaxID=1055687 RepID=G0U4U1_TRYVY|nr:hypothetical protein TVY486_1014990 [Trypanosoma vivax Y486]